jgi:hypothetical protein
MMVVARKNRIGSRGWPTHYAAKFSTISREASRKEIPVQWAFE